MRDAPKLGRGLAALLGQDGPQPEVSGNRLVNLAALDIGPSPHQPRRDISPESLRDLAASISRQGVLQPILVRETETGPPRYQIIAGERRWRAAMQAGLEQIPCVIRRFSEPEASLATLVENLQREDLNAIEEAEGFQQALDRFSMTQESLAQALGKSRSHVANTLRLLNLPASVLKDVQAGRLSAGHARALLTHPDPETGAQAVLARGLNVRQTEALAAASASGSETARTPRGARDPDVRALERDLAEKLGLAISITDRGGKGRLTISYRTLDQLEGIISLLSRG